ncbi:polysaccharide deacetylase family protein [Peterkaempfera bronchialis]|uniref:Polysaccharide deacetylase n=1 Tax=Peterkaempfera bronchialis TaxID=2126346 RepID=A0A345T3N0_9ACTN|nr:polysaccharide deacetylase [Peterkaempfera bronchialis]AXI80585.1 polysaccharide deacetylase [Peterkaempfera bronchialis]
MNSISTRQLSVCLTFDFDALSVWLSGGSVNPAEISRGEFCAVAVPRILRLLAKHDIPATFFVPGHTALAYPELVRDIAEAGHEIGHHGWVHENPAHFDRDGERANFARALEALDRVAGVRPVGFRSPAVDLSVHSIDILLENGMRYDSSCQGSDFTPYYLRQGDRWSTSGPYEFGDSSEIVEVPFSWLLDDFPQFEFEQGFSYTLGSPSKVREIWQGEFDYAYENVPGGVFDLCMHPQVIGRGHRITMLDGLIEHMKSRSGVVFTRMGEYAEQWRAAHPLEAWKATRPVHARRDA